MIETTLRGYLAEALEVPVLLEVPPDPPPSFVLLQRTGGAARDQLCAATFAVQSWAPTLYEAAALNEAVKAAMRGADTLSDIAGVHLNTDYNFTDTAAKRNRYQAVYLVYYY